MANVPNPQILPLRPLNQTFRLRFQGPAGAAADLPCRLLGRRPAPLARGLSPRNVAGIKNDAAGRYRPVGGGSRPCVGTLGFLSRLLFGLLALSLAGATAARAAYPDHPVRIIVAYPAGGSTDIVARIIGNWLSQKLGQQFIVENKPGAGNNIGTELVARPRPTATRCS